MFYPTSRVAYEENLRFFEEDVIMNSHLFSTPASVTLTCDYLRNGIGFIIGLIPNVDIAHQKFYYFLRLDAKSASLFLVNDMYYKRIDHVSTPIESPKENLSIRFDITSNYISLFLENNVYMHVELDNAVVQFHLGVYSQKGNVVKTLTVKEPSPEIWKTNIANVKDGSISFFDNGFVINDCKYSAEILQENIQLKAGKYYLNHDAQNIDFYLYDVESKYNHLSQKNLLKQDNSFELNKPSNLTLYYSGKNGSVKNICITPFQSQNYISTYSTSEKQESSYITLKADLISEANIYFKSNNYCKAILGENDFCNISYSLSIREYCLRVSEGLLQLKIGSLVVFQQEFIGTKINLLKNIDGYISKIIIKDKQGKTFDWLGDTSQDNILEPFINSPIIPYNDKNIPLDISSSFRKINNRYVFTNVERESFTPNTLLNLKNSPTRIVNIIGILKESAVNEEEFYTGTIQDMNDLTAYCKDYISIDQYYVYLDAAQIIIKEALQNYKEIIVDYEKAHSCSINYLTELNRYKVSTTENHYCYYYTTENEQKYYTTPLKEQSDCYVVIEMESEEGD